MRNLDLIVGLAFIFAVAAAGFHVMSQIPSQAEIQQIITK